MRIKDLDVLITTRRDFKDEIARTEQLMIDRTDWDAETRAKIEGSQMGMLFAEREIGGIDMNGRGEPWIHHGMWDAMFAIEVLAKISNKPSYVERFKKQVRW